MEFHANPVTAEFFHHAVPVLMGQLGNGRADIPQVSPGFYRCQTPLQAFFGYGHQIFGPFIHTTDFKHTGSISVIIIQNR